MRLMPGALRITCGTREENRLLLQEFEDILKDGIKAWREAQISRKTRETAITMRLAIAGEGAGVFFGSSGIGFFDHMLSSFAVHGGFKIEANIEGDLYVDGHHSVEDTGIVLGRLFAQILGDRSGIARFGSAYVPMDECARVSAVDISGRPFLVLDAEFSAPQMGGYEHAAYKGIFPRAGI